MKPSDPINYKRAVLSPTLLQELVLAVETYTIVVSCITKSVSVLVNYNRLFKMQNY